jgi:hypothetical protein
MISRGGRRLLSGKAPRSIRIFPNENIFGSIQNNFNGNPARKTLNSPPVL